MDPTSAADAIVNPLCGEKFELFQLEIVFLSLLLTPQRLVYKNTQIFEVTTPLYNFFAISNPIINMDSG